MTAVAADTQPAAAKSSFYAGMRVLPKLEREAMYAIYAFCREVDDIADDQTRPRPDRATALDCWRADLDDLYAGGAGGQAGFLRPAVKRFDLDRVDFEAVIDGMAMDVERDICWPDWAELDLYCDRVASAVGRLSVRVFGMEREPGLALAYHLGRALQLTNILRDIDEDAVIGRLYLPREAIEAAGIAIGDVSAVVADPRLDTVGHQVAARARDHFAAAQTILKGRPRGHLIAPRLMAGAYGELLRRMTAAGWAAPRQRVRHNRLAVMLMLLRYKLAR